MIVGSGHNWTRQRQNLSILPFRALWDTGLPATVRVKFHGRSNTDHLCDVWLNDEIQIGVADWSGEAEYELANPQIPQSFFKNGSNVIRVNNPGSELIDLILLNWIQIDYRRHFHAQEDVLPFAITSLPDETGAVNPNFEVELKNFSTRDVEIYGTDGTRYLGLNPLIDDKAFPDTYRIIFRGTQIRPTDLNAPAIRYIALTRNQFRKPEISIDTPSDLRATHNGADYIIITHNNFISDVQPLADFRSEQGLRTKVVDVQNIYDEFNYGILHPNAIREFLNYAYHNWQPPSPNLRTSRRRYTHSY